MMNNNPGKRDGLILLVVLGMLSLFSLLAVSFAVVSSQSRATNQGRARRDFRGTPAQKLLDAALRPLLRGTRDLDSALHGQGLLDDLYGANSVADPSILLRARKQEFGIAGASSIVSPTTTPYAAMGATSTERPLLLEGRFLRIPVVCAQWPVGVEVPMSASDYMYTAAGDPRFNSATFDPLWDLPRDSDAWTSRIVTFMAGPLQGQSFRVVRYIGDLNYYPTVPAPTAAELDQCYSILIDLSEVTPGVVTVGSETRRLTDVIANDTLSLLYGTVDLGVAPGLQLQDAYQMLLNPAPLNSHGIGINANLAGASQGDALAEPRYATVDPDLHTFPQALQPRTGLSNIPLVGDTDEPYDVADYNDMWLSHRQSGATSSEQITPSFHRPALINYIINLKHPRDYDNGELMVAVNRILRATGRPLSVNVEDESTGTLETLELNTGFDGSNSGDYAATDVQTPQLDVAWTTQAEWQNAANARGYNAFLDWARWLTKGPWDVDGDGDGTLDGMWTDGNQPLITSPEGKLLKVLVAYTVEDLDSRLDLNAAGGLAQGAGVVPEPGVPVYASPTNQNYAAGSAVNLYQGLGRGAGDISLRHLFGTDADYRTFLRSRYAGSSTRLDGSFITENAPGFAGGDIRGQLDMREQRPGPITLGASDVNRHGLLPAMPLANHGRTAVALDRMGNPRLRDAAGLSVLGTPMTQSGNRPYEARILTGSRKDDLFTIEQWEKTVRQAGWDRSNLPRRLTGVIRNPHAVTPRSRHLLHPPIMPPRTAGGANQLAQSHSMYAVLRDMYLHNPPTAAGGGAATIPNYLEFEAFRELFALEFQRGHGFNLNRPLGNGQDDDGDGNVDEPEEALQNLRDDDGDGTVDEWDERNWRGYQQRSIASANNQQPTMASVIEEYLPGRHTVGGTIYHRGIFEGNLDPAFESLAVAAEPNDLLDTNTDLEIDGDTLRYHFGQQTRQLMARNLYCMAMLILPEDLQLSNVPGSTAVTGLERARRLAQWAVNVVDFRDSDSAMTRFPYDPNPFSRSTTTSPFWEPDLTAAQVVWGMEQRDLALTESFATHDLRVKDTSDDPSGDTIATGDPTYDQYRTPEGSAFFELLATRTTSLESDAEVPGVSSSLYDTVGSNKRLNLSQTTPAIDVDGTSTIYPVYRIAISEPHDDPAGAPHTPLALQAPALAAQRLTTTYQISKNPAASGLVWDTASIGTPAPLEIDRVVLFTAELTNLGIPDLTGGLTTPAAQADRAFFNQNGTNITLQGGQYLVVGPRQVTYFGSRSSAGDEHQPNPHRIELGSGSGLTPAAANSWASVIATDTAGTQNTLVPKRTATLRDCVTMVAAQDANWASRPLPVPRVIHPDAATTIGLNVSAPYRNNYYSAPEERVNSGNTGADTETGALGYSHMDQPADGYYDFGGGTTTSLPDQPFDGASASRPLSASSTLPHQWKYQSGAGQPDPGTQLNWCTAFLQRLADPDRPWHEVFNPYITVDWIPVDLTVFSGEENVPVSTDPGADYKFATRQKTGAMIDLATPARTYLPITGTTLLEQARTFFSYDTTTPPVTTATAASSANFDHELNVEWIVRTGHTTIDADHTATLGYLNSTFGILGEPTVANYVASFAGAPSVMPTSLFWADRQFANPLEILSVPLSAPGQLNQEIASQGTATITATPYSSTSAVGQFTHLPNFFMQVGLQDGTSSTNQFSAAVLLELLETPSPWSDADDIIQPGTMFSTAGSAAQNVAVSYILAPLRAPYNRISRFVEPGRVNINNMSEPDVWQGVMWNVMDPTARNLPVGAAVPGWGKLLNSRAGYDVSSPTPGVLGTSANPYLHALSPTQFGGAFKPAFSAGMVPETPNTPNVLDTVARDATGGVVNPTGVTLLRADLQTPALPLFNRNYTPVGAVLPVNVTQHSRHPFEEYLLATRLANLTTMRSNVFAVRVTVGFFEYDPSTGLGREYGIDDGTVKRHRGFYVIDRSIPVGYREGFDLNTDKCVLLRRVIE